MRRRHLIPLAVSLSIWLGISCFVRAQSAPKLGLPIDCSLGQDCFILQYFDRDPGPASIDFGCGRMTSDGHSGTDFAIPDERTMAAGVPVLSAAAGQVLRIRDGVPDRRVEDPADLGETSGQECGNGAIVDIGGGWTTQYCHLRQGSVAVQPGEEVEQGQVLGLVGESGLASFPHVHMTVSYRGSAIDPFVGRGPGEGCQVQLQPLWETSIPYTPTGLIRVGFSTAPPELDQLWAGEFRETRLPADSPALIFWVHAYGVLQGDRESIQLIDPSGTVVAEGNRDVELSQRIWASFVGKRGNPEGFSQGDWHGRYQLSRGGEILVDTETLVTVTD